ncbi:hypothetical protein ACQPZP_14555 [Spirillospora sp. CA-142024]
MLGLKKAQAAVDDAKRTVSTAAVISVVALAVAVVALAVAVSKGN